MAREAETAVLSPAYAGLNLVESRFVYDPVVQEQHTRLSIGRWQGAKPALGRQTAVDIVVIYATIWQDALRFIVP